MITTLAEHRPKPIRVLTEIPPRYLDRAEALVDATLDLSEDERARLIMSLGRFMRHELEAGRAGSSFALATYVALLTQQALGEV